MIDKTIPILAEKRLEWIKKRALYIELRQEQIDIKDKENEKKYNDLIDKCQESINDFGEVIETIKNIYNHEKQMELIINNQNF